MKWIEVQVKTTTEAVEAITNILYEVGVNGVVIEDSKDIITRDVDEYELKYVDPELLDQKFEGAIVKGYLQECEDLIDKVELIRQNVEKIPQYNLDKGLGEVTTSEIYDKDWANTWKKHYKPKKIGKKIVIKPSWEEYNKKNDEIIVEIDPGMAFGTGTHETTVMCIRQLERYIHKHDVVFDIGCGTGILSIASSKLGAITTIGVDIDKDSVTIAKENVRKNGVQNTVEIREGNLLDVVSVKANVIVANIITEVLKPLSKDIVEYMEEDSVFISSGILHDKSDSLKEEFKKNGLVIIDEIVNGEWVCLISKRKG